MISVTAVTRFTVLSLLAGMVALQACSDASGPVAGGVGLTDISVVPGAEPANVLAARISFVSTGADSVRVAYQVSGGTQQFTPFENANGSDTIWVLGLHPSSTYTYHIESVRAGATTTSSAGTFSTQALPAALTDVKMDHISGNTSYYFLAGVRPGGATTGGYAVAFDSSGAVAWYHDLTSTGLNVSNVVQQPNGNITAFVGNTTGSQAVDGYYVEITPSGNEVHTYRAPSGYYTDDHELLLTGDGANLKAHFITYSIRTVDLSSLGGNSNVQLAGHQIVRENASGQVEFTWSAWDHIDLDEWVGDDNVKETATSGDFDHPNAIVIDRNGNYVVSWRNLNQIMSIDSQTGNVLWRIGGERSDYTVVGDPLNGFTKQHSVKMLPNGNLLLYDNGTEHDPQESRAVEYQIDPTAKTATYVWEYHHDPAIYTPFVGWVQRLSDGNTIVSFALAGRATEVGPSGNVLWESQLMVNGATGSSYRIVPAKSLYAYSAL